MKKIKLLLAIPVLFALFTFNTNKAEAFQKVELPVLNFSDIGKIINFDGKFRLDKFMEARRGGGRSGGSFGRSRSRSSSSSAPRRSTSPSTSSRRSLSGNPAKTPSFGGTRMSKSEATAKYGVPRKQSTITSNNQLGQPVNYRVNDYGGFSSGLMTGYMMGNMSWWMMAPAMFYSRPIYVENQDGTVDVYPPTLSVGKILIAIIIIAAIVMIIRAVIKSRKQLRARETHQSSFV